jgi:hypothetical protein
MPMLQWPDRRRVLTHAGLVLGVVALIGIGLRAILGYWPPKFELALWTGAGVVVVVLTELLRLAGWRWTTANAKLLTVFATTVTAVVTLGNTLADWPVGRAPTSQNRSAAPPAGAPGGAIAMNGEWTGRYTWKNLRTGRDETSEEHVVIDTHDTTTGRFSGLAKDRDGQKARVEGQVFQQAVVLYYVSLVGNRDSYGSATLEFDRRNANVLEGLLIMNEVDQRQLMSGRYRWEKNVRPSIGPPVK